MIRTNIDTKKIIPLIKKICKELEKQGINGAFHYKITTNEKIVMAGASTIEHSTFPGNL